MTFDNPHGQPTTPLGGPPYPSEPLYPGDPGAPAYPGLNATQALPPWDQPPAPPTGRGNRTRTLVIAGVAAVAVAGVAAGAVALTSHGSSKKLSEAEICNEVKKGGDLVRRATPNGGTLTVTPGGTAPAGVPALPSGKKAGCTMTLTVENITIPVYIAAYDKKASLDGYRTTLLGAGYTSDAQGQSASPLGETLSDSSNHMVLLLSVGDFKAIELLTIPG